MLEIAQKTLSFSSFKELFLSNKRTVALIICFLVLNAFLSFMLGSIFLISIASIAAIDMLVLFLAQPGWVLILYVLVAGPSIAFAFGGSGVLSRLYAGNLVMAFVIVVGGIRTIMARRNVSAPLTHLNLIISLSLLAVVGLISIVHSRLQPDPGVVYAFVHSTVSLDVVDIAEMVLLLGLPILLLIVSSLIRNTNDVRWLVRALMCLGMAYSVGVFFAGPLGLNTQYIILGFKRPQVFGISSSVLGFMLVLFTCIALGHALYEQKPRTSFGWWVCTAILTAAAILAIGRTAWLSLLVAVLIMVSFRIKTLVVIPGIVLLLSLLLVPTILSFYDPAQVYGIDRLNIWQDAINIWLHGPIFGIGAGNYQFFDLAYGTDIGGVAHSQFLEVLAEMGVQGLICLVWSMVATGHLALQRFQIATTSRGKALTLAYIGYYGGLVIFSFFGDSFLPSVAVGGGTEALILASYNWILLCIVFTLPQWEKPMLVEEQDSQETPVSRRTSTLPGCITQHASF